MIYQLTTRYLEWKMDHTKNNVSKCQGKSAIKDYGSNSFRRVSNT